MTTATIRGASKKKEGPYQAMGFEFPNLNAVEKTELVIFNYTSEKKI